MDFLLVSHFGVCTETYRLALVYPPSSSADLDKRFTAQDWFKNNGDTLSREGGGGWVLISAKVARHDSGGGRSTLAMKHLEEQREAFLKFYKGWDVDKGILK